MANYCGYTKEKWRALTKEQQLQAINLDYEKSEAEYELRWQNTLEEIASVMGISKEKALAIADKICETYVNEFMGDRNIETHEHQLALDILDREAFVNFY